MYECWSKMNLSCCFRVCSILTLCVHMGMAVVAQSPDFLCTSANSTTNNAIVIHDIIEDVPVGTSLGYILLQGLNAQIDAMIDNEYLEFDMESRNIKTKNSINGIGNRLVTYLKCTIKESQIPIDTLVVVTILDINNHPPVFQNVPYKANLSELSPVGSTVTTSVYASDNDPSNNYVAYEVLEGPFSTHFTFSSPAQGILTLLKRVDYEQVTSISLTICAKDNHADIPGRIQPQFNATTTLTITVIDEDDQNPAFIGAPYWATVEENTPKDTVIDVQPRIKAQDQDTIQADVRYVLLNDSSSNDNNFFTIDPNTAQVRLANEALVRERQFVLLVKATKVTNPKLYAVSAVRVTVQASNENAPKFTQDVYEARLVENVPVGSHVVIVNAVDNDEWMGTILRYSFVDQVEDFEINELTGYVTTSKELDYSRERLYDITVQVTDGNKIDTAKIAVEIINVNIHSPKFTQSVYIFQTDKTPDKVLGTVEASDSDPGTVISYSFLDNSTKFLIDPNGEISTLDDIDIYTLNYYTIVVIATDNDRRNPREGTCVVEIEFPGGPVDVKGEGNQTNLIIMIIFAVLCAGLLVLVIVMFVYIYRKSQKAPNDLVRSRSFEKEVNFANKDYKSYMNNPEGLTYTQRQQNNYSNGRLDEDSTRPQQNPFVADNVAHLYSSATRQPTLDHDYTSTNSSLPAGGGRMSGINEIEYETAVMPAEEMYEDNTLTPTSSINDSTLSMGGASFKDSGSTQQLVNPKLSFKERNSGVSSYFDSTKSSLYSSSTSQNDSMPRTMSDNENKPGITIYY